MLIYHYSKMRYTTIKSRALQRNDNTIPREKIGINTAPHYDHHVSFFHQRPPLEELPTFFPKDHDTWTDGNRLFEYAVEVDDIDLFYWQSRETKIEEFYRGLPMSDDLFTKLRVYEVREFQRKLAGYEGKDKSSLKKWIAAQPEHQIRDAYLAFKEKARKYNDHRNPNLEQYASTVPHLMIFINKPIKYRELYQVVVGSTQRDRIK